MLTQRQRDVFLSEVARLLSEARIARGISMNGLATLTGLSQSMISTFETRETNPTLDSLVRISAALDVSLGETIVRAQEAAQAVKKI